jgi:hypothetical protein
MLAKYKRKKRRESTHVITSDKTIPEYDPPSRQAAEFHASDADIRAIFGGDRSGKTEPGSYEIVRLMRLHPGKIFWACSQTQTTSRILWRKQLKYLHPSEIAHVSYAKRGEEIVSYWRHRNGAECFFKTYSSGPAVFASESVYGIHLDEDPERITTVGEMIYNDCLSRIIDCKGKIWVTATPVLGKNWMYQRLYKRNIDNREDHTPDSDIQTWTVSLLDNKYVGEAEKRKAKGRMSQDEIERRFYGKFTTLQGMVCKEWREDLSVRDFGKLNTGVRKAAGIDFGSNHPFCCEWVALHDGRLYHYDEYYHASKVSGSRTIDIHTQVLVDRDLDLSYFEYTGNNAGIEAYACDWDLGMQQELTAWSSRYGHTLPIVKANKESVDLRIQYLNRMMKPDDNGQPSLFVHPRCYQLIRQFGSVHYKTQRVGSDEKEKIVKIDDDAFDATGYGDMYFYQGETDINIEAC